MGIKITYFRQRLPHFHCLEAATNASPVPYLPPYCHPVTSCATRANYEDLFLLGSNAA
jgi:hypothetical protein